DYRDCPRRGNESSPNALPPCCRSVPITTFSVARQYGRTYICRMMNGFWWRSGTIFLLLAAGTSSGWAGDASPWEGGPRAAVRLIAAGATGDGAGRILRGGIEIRLAPGWKTYWRYPGDSGVPPRFEFTRSTNLSSVTVG